MRLSLQLRPAHVNFIYKKGANKTGLTVGHYLNELGIRLNRVGKEGRIAGQQAAPIAANVRKLEMLAQKRGAAFRNLTRMRIVAA